MLHSMHLRSMHAALNASALNASALKASALNASALNARLEHQDGVLVMPACPQALAFSKCRQNCGLTL